MRRIPYDEYARIKATNWSALKHMRKSPKHYKFALDNPRKDTTRLALGRAAHTAVLEPDRFMIEYACFKGGDRRGKKWLDFKAQHEGETILKLSEYETCLRIRDAVRSHPVAASYLRAGLHEATLTWEDKGTGLACKGRVDWISDSVPAVVDLKTTGDIGAHRFAGVAARMGYHTQSAFYRDGYMTAMGALGELVPGVVIAVEVEAPHDVAVYRIDEDCMYAGSEEYGELLLKVRRCMQSGEWPGQYPDQQDLRLPNWVWGDEEYATDLGDEITFGASASEATAQEE